MAYATNRTKVGTSVSPALLDLDYEGLLEADVYRPERLRAFFLERLVRSSMRASRVSVLGASI